MAILHARDEYFINHLGNNYEKIIFSVLVFCFLVGSAHAAIVSPTIAETLTLAEGENGLVGATHNISDGTVTVNDFFALTLATSGGPVGTTIIEFDSFTSDFEFSIFSATSTTPWTYNNAVVALGTSVSGLLEIALTGPGDFIIQVFGNITGTSLINGIAPYSISISTVPVPAAALLFGSALLGMLGFSRRKSSKGML